MSEVLSCINKGMIENFSSEGKRSWTFSFAVMEGYEMGLDRCCLTFRVRDLLGFGIEGRIPGEMLHFSGQS